MKFIFIGENCLLKLKSFDQSIFGIFAFISSIYIRQLAAFTPKNHIVKVLERRSNINFAEKCDVVHIHFKTATAIRAYEIADEFKRHGKKIVLSGSHPSALPEEAKYHADCVLIGSAEMLWPDVVRDLENDELKPFYTAESSMDKKTFRLPDYIMPSEMSLVGVIETTRGCPYQCDFCQESNIINGSFFRTRDLEDVLQEIKSMPQKILFFCDVSLTIDPDYTKSLFKSMKSLKKKFVCEGNADVLSRDEELLKLSFEAGCIEWTVGFESFTQHVLENVHKKTNMIEDYTNVVRNIRRNHMAVLGNFIFGFDHDNPGVFKFTLKHIKKLGLNSARFAILTPYPGTPLFNNFDSEGRILTRDWSKYNRKTVVFQPKNMTPEELRNGFMYISRNFSSPSNTIKRDLQSLQLGFYPFLATVGRNLESYMNRPKIQEFH